MKVRVINSILCCIFFMSSLTYANHRVGLFLQLPDKTVEIKKSDVEELQTFLMDRNHKGMMLKLKAPVGEKLTALTAPLIGKTILWIWNGRVISVSKLTTPLSKDINILNFTTQEAEELSNCIHLSIQND